MPEPGTMTLNVESNINVGGLGVSGKASIDTQGRPSASLNVDTPLGSVGTSDAKLPTSIPSNLNPEASTKGYLEYCY